MSRNTKGIIGWTALTLVLSAVITLPVMICREWYQCTHYGIEFEWDDVRRYGLTIIIAQIAQSVVLWLVFG